MSRPWPGKALALALSVAFLCVATMGACATLPGDPEPRRWLWVQDYSSDARLYTQAGIDELVDRTVGKFTDLVLAARLDGDARMWFRSSLAAMQDRQIDGLTIGEYLIQRAHEKGMRVHAWIYTGWWATYLQMKDPPSATWNTSTLDDGRCNTVAWVNMAEPGARQMIAGMVGDLVAQNQGLDGIHLDYIRVHHTQSACPVITPDHISQLLIEARRAIGRDCELTVSISGNQVRNEEVKRDVPRWLSEGLADQALMMSYTSVPIADKLAYIATLPSRARWRIVPGVSDVDGTESLRDQLGQWAAAKYNRFAVFDSYHLMDDMLALLE